MHSTRVPRRAAPILLAAVLLTACSSGHDGASSPAADGASPAVAGRASASAAPVAAGSGGATSPDAPAASPSETASYPTTGGAPGTAVPQVRDSFAVLQATYNDGCTTPGNCEYFLTRLVKNLDDLYDSMKAGPKGAGHFAAPIARIRAMQDAFKGDFSFPNLKRHQKLLLDTRDMVNTWMQDYPEDYR